MLSVLEHGGQRLPLGGHNGYAHVRGGQGKRKNKYQGISPKRQHRTKAIYDTSLEAALAYQQMMEDVELGLESDLQQKKKPLPLASPATLVKPPQVASYNWSPPPLICVAAAALSEQQAAAAVARGVKVAYAEPMVIPCVRLA